MLIKGVHIVPEPVIQNTCTTKTTSPGKQIESFQDYLSQSLTDAKQVKLSAHAKQRMIERNIVLNQTDWHKINNAINKAENKGARNSLLIHGELALIVSVKNRTVISAMDEVSMKEHVFTNIDSAVIIK
ncbi:TIGR02530 family flagellar biosynthesis protein [Desulfoscipio gibsoniae]|uniref:Flagellar operon protein n=1 Tax=Desulfoscipio gibsoniae DSM 7213 TaxID=767817 RepID=R4KJ47_9FIRM|nr:TIGR02530 family flagellar biosynthesis protein [Desulfoscipio gibsoniae]AGL01652.1 flagellar operon protein [Desulfoscipio gibsoniae DSM 7213]